MNTPTISPISLGRIRSITRAELLLLSRNRAALVNAMLPPLAVVGLISSTHSGGGGTTGGLSSNAFVTTALLGFVMLSTVYYNLVTTYVARREGLVLKRLRVGEITDVEILTGAASASIVLAVAQILLFGIASAVALGLPVPVNLPVFAVGMLGGVALFALLAAASATFTRTVEMAQITTLPVLFACVLGSGTMFPLDSLPRPLADVLQYLPLTPPVELLRLGWLGTTGKALPVDFAGAFGAAAEPTAILAAWTVVGVLVVRRWFRWEPRR